MRAFVLVATAGFAASIASAQVLPGGAHVANNFIPFGANDSMRSQQVFQSGLFGTATRITNLGFAPGVAGAYTSNVALRLGYTNAIPGQASASGGLAIPTGAGGLPNNFGPMFGFYSNAAFAANFAAPGSANFQMDFANPDGFVYFPGLGNLLMEVDSTAGATLDLTVSRAAGSSDSSRAITSTRFGNLELPTQALRVDFDAASVVPTTLPTWPHFTGNYMPFGRGDHTVHQVHHRGTLIPMSAGGKLAIQGLRFAPVFNGTWVGAVRVNMGTTVRVPSFGSAQSGLGVPVAGGGGAPNAIGPMTTFLNRANFGTIFTGSATENFQMLVRGRPFIYDPVGGNLLIEYVSSIPATTLDHAVSRANGSLESSRSFTSNTFGAAEDPTRAIRTRFVASRAVEPVLPSSGHAVFNFVPFGRGQHTVHQVFAASQFGAGPIRVHSIAFAPGATGQYDATNVTIRLGYTNATPGVTSPAGLAIPTSPAGGGAPNALFPMTTFYSGPFSMTIGNALPDLFDMVFVGNDAVRYNPALGNLLVEIVTDVPTSTLDLPVSRADGGPLSSRSWRSSRFGNQEVPNQAARMKMLVFADLLGCEADLDGDGAVDFNDFLAFLNLFNAGDPAVDFNDDGAIDFNDFLAYLNLFNQPC